MVRRIKDVDAIIDLFAEDALDDIDEDELEDSIQELIDTFPDWDGHEYEFHLVFIYEANHEDRVGLYGIQINDNDIMGYTSEGYYCRPHYETEPGVYCWDCDIR